MVNLTRQEKLTLCLVGVTALVGVGLNYYKKILPSVSLEQIIQAEKSRTPLNINTANLNDLANIPDIGPGLARDLIAFRNLKGPFKSLEELKLVKGVSVSKFNRIKNFLSLE